MILRVLATVAILALLVLDGMLPGMAMFRQGHEIEARAHAPAAVPRVGEPMPDFTLPDIDGVAVTLSDWRGHRVLLTFERSVDW